MGDDLATMSALGGNAVRLYHSFGLHENASHVGFLDHAEAVGLNVIPGWRARC